MAPSSHSSVAPWSRARTYPLWGAGLALGAPLGYLALRVALHAEPGPVTGRWVIGELSSNPIAYAYLVIATVAVFMVLGALLGRKEDALESSSATDPLTRLWNRRHLRRRLDEEIGRATRLQTPLAVLFVDVDRLKALNDRWGHEAGDAALELVAETLHKTCRASDVAARYGGDEFVVLAPDTTAQQAGDLAERVRGALRDRVPSVTVSVGVADLERARSVDADSLVEAADRAVYHAKSVGRNRVELAPICCRRQRDRSPISSRRPAPESNPPSARSHTVALALTQMRMPLAATRAARRKRAPARRPTR